MAPLSRHPTVSILMSNYNYGVYIKEAIDSVLSQTYADLDVIICDDGSTDHSCDIVSEYCQSDSRVRLIRKRNGGQASGFNAAFAASRGELIFFLDSDDVFYASKVALMLRAHQDNPSAGFGVHRVLRVNRRRRPRGVYPLRPLLPSGWCGEHLLATGGVLPYMPPTSALSLHRSVAERIFPLPLKFRLNADQLIARCAPLLTAIVPCDQVLAEYRQHDKNFYITNSVSVASIRKELITCVDLWDAQRIFLIDNDPAQSAMLAPSEDSSYFIFLEYLLARLSGSPLQRIAYRRFLADLRAGGAPRMRLWFCSFYVPRFIFRAIVSALISPGLLKQFVSRARNLV